MATNLRYRSPDAFDRMSQDDANAVLASARTLQRAAAAGQTQALLRGKNFALLCEADISQGDAALFRRAVLELGGHVAHIRPSLSELSTPTEVQHTARMLGRLYDAVECEGLSLDLVRQMGQQADVPFFDAVASPLHATARLAELLGEDASPDLNRRYVLQAVLLSTLA